MGIPATFIRFAGCNLRCSWCDTKNSWETGQEMSCEEIISNISHSVVIITGGEPGIYDLSGLVTALHKNAGKFGSNKPVRICIETNGTKQIPWDIDWIVCSPKPDADYQIRCQPHELKYVVDDKFSIQVIPSEYLGKIPVWLQPNSEDLERSMAKSYELVMKHDFLRLGVQLHKIYNLK